MRKTQKQQGFTIIELVVVIVILGILAAVAFPKFQDLSGDARTAVLNGAKAAVQSAAVMVLQKRSGVWYAYSFGSHKWLKGRAGELATVQHVHAMPAFVTVNSLNQWPTPPIRGLRTGEISVRAFAFDGAFNDGRAPVVRQLITRS